MAAKKKIEKKFLTYRGKPLVRCGNVIYYGNMNDKYVIKMDVKSSEPLKDVNVSNKISVRLLDTDPDLSSSKKIIKASEKKGLYEALDVAGAWLERALEK